MKRVLQRFGADAFSTDSSMKISPVIVSPRKALRKRAVRRETWNHFLLSNRAIAVLAPPAARSCPFLPARFRKTKNRADSLAHNCAPPAVRITSRGRRSARNSNVPGSSMRRGRNRGDRASRGCFVCTKHSVKAQSGAWFTKRSAERCKPQPHNKSSIGSYRCAIS